MLVPAVVLLGETVTGVADRAPGSEVVRHSAVGDRRETCVAGRPSGRRRWLVVTAVVLFAVGSLLLLEATNAGDGQGPRGNRSWPRT